MNGSLARFPIAAKKDRYVIPVPVRFNGQIIETLHRFDRPSNISVRFWMESDKSEDVVRHIYWYCREADGYALPANDRCWRPEEYVPFDHQERAVLELMEQIVSELVGDGVKV